jgi:hypothetical protein
MRIREGWFRSTRGRTQTCAFLLIAVLVALLVHNLNPKPAAAEPVVPTNAAMEQATGVRFTRIAVVGDGGLVEVSYSVLDADKATRFQSDQLHPPVLTNEGTGTSTKRVALMKQGHTLREGQTYYFVYHNEGTVHGGDQAALEVGGAILTGFPVQ